MCYALPAQPEIVTNKIILRYTHSTWLLFRSQKMILEVCTCSTCNLCRQYHFTLHLNNLILTRFVQLDFKVLYLHKLKSFSTISLYTIHALLHSYILISGFYTCTTWNLHLFGKMTYFTLHLHTRIFLTSPNFPGFFILGMCVCFLASPYFVLIFMFKLSRGPKRSTLEQLFFLRSWEWLLQII